MRHQRTLVTGALGFVGSRLVRHLVAQGERVKAFVRPGSNLHAIADLDPDRLELAYGDITVESSLYQALAGCDRLYHVATPTRWWDPRPERILAPAIEGTRTALTAARRRGIAKVVVTSGASTLGVVSRPTPIDELHPFAPKNLELHALAQQRAEQEALEFATEGLPVVVVQPSVVLGPGDWRPSPAGRWVRDRLGARHPPPVFPGGISVVDVDDVCLGHRQAMEQGKVGECYLLGGENLTFREFWSLLADITGLCSPARDIGRTRAAVLGALHELRAHLWANEAPFTRRMARSELVGYAWVNSRKAELDLGYVHRPARQTLKRAVRFFAEHHSIPEERRARFCTELA